MKQLKNEQGYTLFLTVLITLLFGILSVLLLSVTVSGVKKNKVREDITQATELSEKGLEHITQLINQELEEALGTDGLSRELFIAKLEGILNKYKCDANGSINSYEKALGDYDVCIEDFEDDIGSNGELNELRKLVTFRSIGTVDGRDKLIKSNISFGSASVPEVLKYVLGTNITSSNPRNGEGNLLLHGSVDIKGDIKVDGNLAAYHKSTAAYKWVPSLLPRVLPTTSQIQPKLVLGKNMYQINSDPNTGSGTSHNNYLNNDNFNTSRYTVKSSPNDLFMAGYAPKIVKREPKPNNIQIKEHKNNYFYHENSSGVQKVRLSNNTFSNYTNLNNKVFPYRCSGNNCSNNYNISVTMQNTNNFKSLATKNNLVMLKGNHTFTDGLYVGRNLTIGNSNQTDNANQRDNINLEGNMFIDGDVTIQGANLTSNAMMYVDGDVTIRWSSIKGKQLGNGETGTLIIFATGDVYLANNSVNADNPSEIKGYFHSEKNIEIYGTGSNIKIDGGVSANRIVLNAIRGRASNKRFSQSYQVDASYYEGVSNQKNKNSRLQIHYDTELIESYLKLNPPEPVIYGVDPPELKDREY